VENLVYLPPIPKEPVLIIVNDHKLLEGLKGVNVSVNVDDQTNSPISQRLQIAVELHLRTAGIAVQKHDDGPTLVLTVTALPGSDRSLAFYNMEGALTDKVYYKRMMVFGAHLWSTGHVRSITNTRYEQALVEDAQGIADKFANEFLAANPKK